MQLEVAMRSALSLAKRGIGCCSPNPSVGCLILDRSNNLIGMGRTSDKGRPHAEMNAFLKHLIMPKDQQYMLL